jgi:acylphosphatase
MKRLLLEVAGRVQGVFFRQGVKMIADELGIRGWVRNETDGSVKIVAEAEEQDLRKLLEWCRNGTELAKVENIREQWSEGTGAFTRFEVL